METTDSKQAGVFCALMSCTLLSLFERKACLAFYLMQRRTVGRPTSGGKREYEEEEDDAEAEADNDDEDEPMELDVHDSGSRPSSKTASSKASVSKGGPYKKRGTSSSDLAEVQYFCT